MTRSKANRRSSSSIFRVPRLQLSIPTLRPAKATVTIIAMIVRLTRTSMRVNPQLLRERIRNGPLQVIVGISDFGHLQGLDFETALTGTARPRHDNVDSQDRFRGL